MSGNWDDHYTKQARVQGYPARSVFKLEEIQRRLRVFPPKGVVLDLGAAPGSWSLYVLRKSRARILAVDLQPMEVPAQWGDRFAFVQGDLFHQEVAAAIADCGPYDVILSDAAPSTSGHRVQDATLSAELVRRVLQIAAVNLKPGGNLVAKILQGGEERALLSQMRRDFARARALKPAASRKASSEVFLIGLELL